jgi:AraC-like DNA-binding protein/beta-xylosidase/mannose-6-phosphate isomerase-like protein (cupin superfamily)
MIAEPVYEVVEYDGHSPFKAFITGIRTINPHVHEDLEIGYVVSGIGQLLLARTEVTLKTEDLFVVNCNTVHSMESQAATPLVLLMIQVRPALLEMLNIPVRTIEFRCTPALAESRAGADALQKLRAYCMGVVRHVTRGSPEDGPMIAAHLLSILSLLLRRFPRSKRKEDRQAERSKYYDRIIRIIRYLNDNFADEISLKMVAEEMSMSVYHLCHIFKKTAGVSLGRYLTNVRLEKVKEQLLSQDDSVTNIAMNCGFNNLGYFYKIFHATMGCTPLQFKTQNAQGHIPKKQVSAGTLDAFHSAAIGNYLQVDRELIDTHLPRGGEPAEQDGERAERQRPKIVDIAVDVHGPAEQIHLPALSIITLRGMVDGDAEEWKERLADLKRNVGFEYVRFDLPEPRADRGASGSPPAARLRPVLHAIRDLSAKPFIRLPLAGRAGSGPTKKRPAAQARGATARGAATRAPGAAAARSRFPALAAARFGKEETKGWCWEVASAPLGASDPIAKSDEYLRYYGETARWLKKTYPHSKVGGTVEVLLQDREQPRLRSFLYYCMVEKVPLDFLTLQVAPGARNLPGESLSLLGLGESGALMDTLKTARDIVEKTLHARLDLHVDLLPICSGLTLAAREMAAVTTLVIETGLATTGLADTVSLLSCVATAPSAALPMNPAIYPADLVDPHGAYLPAFHAWWFLARAGDASLRRGPEFLVTRKNRDRVQVLIWNSPGNRPFPAPPRGAGARSDGQQIGESYFHVEINGLTGLYKGMEYSFDRRHGSLADKWLEIGSPAACNPDELETLREGARVKRAIYPVQYKGRFSKLFTVRPYGVKLVELYPAEANP